MRFNNAKIYRCVTTGINIKNQNPVTFSQENIINTFANVLFDMGNTKKTGNIYITNIRFI